MNRLLLHCWSCGCIDVIKYGLFTFLRLDTRAASPPRCPSLGEAVEALSVCCIDPDLVFLFPLRGRTPGHQRQPSRGE